MSATTTGTEEETGREHMSAVKLRRLQDRKEWEAYWQIRQKETEGTFIPRYVYKLGRFIDGPVTWFRENIVEPLHDKHKLPYYHRKINRVPEIDQCGVNDTICLYEAEEQFRLDKLVDYYIKDILFNRFEQCLHFYGFNQAYHCVQQLEDYENADLNFFIKYGELGSEQSVVACYMKQKHRLIWERRHPEIMEERKRLYEEHLGKMRDDKYNVHFWKKFYPYAQKRDYAPGQFYGPHWKHDKHPMEGDTAISKDWRYYKKLEEDPSFDTVNYPKKWNEMARREKEKKQQQNGNSNDNNANVNGSNGNGIIYENNRNGNGERNGNKNENGVK